MNSYLPQEASLLRAEKCCDLRVQKSDTRVIYMLCLFSRINSTSFSPRACDLRSLALIKVPGIGSSSPLGGLQSESSHLSVLNLILFVFHFETGSHYVLAQPPQCWLALLVGASPQFSSVALTENLIQNYLDRRDFELTQGCHFFLFNRGRVGCVPIIPALGR